MEVYLEARTLFPMLPGEIWEKIMWFVLLQTMKEKLTFCLPMWQEFDVMEDIRAGEEGWDWDGHSHTTIMANNVLNNLNIVCYDHIFYTDCCMWLDSEEDPSLNHEDIVRTQPNRVYYKTHTFGLVKQRKDGEKGTITVNYLTYFYLDGSTRLVSIDYE
jgi:hypothetical protein